MIDRITDFLSDVNPLKDRLTYEPGKNNDGTGNVLKYDVPFLLSFGWVVPFRGSMFTSRMFLSVGIALAFVLILSQFTCRIVTTTAKSAEAYCVPIPIGYSGNITLLSFTSFLVGLFANTLLMRWWNLRMNLVGHFGGNNEVMILAATALANSKLVNENKDYAAEAKQACYAIYRYLNLANYLTIFNATHFFNYELLLHNEMLTKSEYEMIKLSSGSPNVAYSWINSRLQKLATAGFLGAFPGPGYANLTNMQAAIASARSSCIAVITFVDTSLPYPFVQLITVVQNACLLQVLVVSAATIGQGWHAEDYGLVFGGLLTTITFTAVMRSLLFLYYKVQNPLGEGASDFPVTTYLEVADKSMLFLMNNIFRLSLKKRFDSNKTVYGRDELTTKNITMLHFDPNCNSSKLLRTVDKAGNNYVQINRGSYSRHAAGVISDDDSDDETEYGYPDDSDDDPYVEDDDASSLSSPFSKIPVSGQKDDISDSVIRAARYKEFGINDNQLMSGFCVPVGLSDLNSIIDFGSYLRESERINPSSAVDDMSVSIATADTLLPSRGIPLNASFNSSLTLSFTGDSTTNPIEFEFWQFTNPLKFGGFDEMIGLAAAGSGNGVVSTPDDVASEEGSAAPHDSDFSSVVSLPTRTALPKNNINSKGGSSSRVDQKPIWWFL